MKLLSDQLAFLVLMSFNYYHRVIGQHINQELTMSVKNILCIEYEGLSHFPALKLKMFCAVKMLKADCLNSDEEDLPASHEKSYEVIITCSCQSIL